MQHIDGNFPIEEVQVGASTGADFAGDIVEIGPEAQNKVCS